MRYLEKQVHMETLHLPSVQTWLGNELESRGIDSMIYSRHIIQLLQQDDEEEMDCPDYFDFNKYKPKLNKKGKVKKPEKSNPVNLEKTEDRKKSAAIECLQAAVSEEDSRTGIKILVEELCAKLKEVSKPSNLEDPEVLQLSDSSTSTEEADTPYSSPELSVDPAERYYAAFPALHGQEKSECSDFSSPYNQDSVDVWKKNPITKSSSEGIVSNFDSGNESEKDIKHRAGKDKGTQTRSENKSSKSNRKKKSSRNQSKSTAGKNNDGTGKFCRFASWPQDWNYISDSAVDYHKDKERELCSQVESLLKEILLPHAKYDTQNFFEKANRTYYRTAPASLSEDRFSPELQEKDFWYTQPFNDLFEVEEASTPFHQRLYKRHSYPSFECFNQTDELDSLNTSPSPYKRCDDSAQHVDEESMKVTEIKTDSQATVTNDTDETLGMQLLSLEEINDGEREYIDRDMFGLQELNLNESASHHDVSQDNDDSFGLKSLMMEKEYFENLLEDDLPEKDILVMPIEEFVPDALPNPNHSSYFLSSSPWTATENDFREVVIPHEDGTVQVTHENSSDYTSLDQNINGHETGQNQNVGQIVSEENQNVSKNKYEFYREDNLPLTDSLSSLFDFVLKPSRDSSTSSNSSTSVTTMTEHSSNTEWPAVDSEVTSVETSAVPGYDLFTHPFSSHYASFHSTDLLSPASSTNDQDISIPVNSNETCETSNGSSNFIPGKEADISDGSAFGWHMSSGSQLGFGGKASQLWDVNYQGKKIPGFAYPWKPFQYLDHLQETPAESNLMQSVTIGNNQSDEDASLNTLIPQITFSLVSEEEESAFMNAESDEENVEHGLCTQDCRKDFDRSYSLNELSSLMAKTDSLGMNCNSQLSKSFELVPSEHSAFQDVIPKRIKHAVSEPNLQQYHLESKQNEPKFLNECLPHTPKKSTDSTSPKEHLFFSPKTHFQPIQTPVGKNSETDTSSDFHLRDLFGGYPKTSKTPYQKFQDARSDSSEESFIPMFKLRKEHDKYIQTNTSITYQTEDLNFDGEDYGNICSRCGNVVQAMNAEQEECNECICMEFYQNALEDFDIYGYVDSLTVSETNTPQNVPVDNKNACTDSGYEDFDTGDAGFEGSRNSRYLYGEAPFPPLVDIPSDNAFECITVEKSSGEKQVFTREDGWVMYKVEGGLGLQCLNEAHIRKNLKYAKAGKDEEEDKEDKGEDEEEFLMHQVEEEWLLNGYYCEGDVLDDMNCVPDCQVTQSMWSTGQDSRREQILMDHQYPGYDEPYLRKISESSYSINPYASESDFCSRNFVQEALQPRDDEVSQRDSSKLTEDVGNLSNFHSPSFRSAENSDTPNGSAVEAIQAHAPLPVSAQQDEDVVKVKLVFHHRENELTNVDNEDMYSNTVTQENIDPQMFMPMPSQAVFSTDLEEEWLKGNHEKAVTSQTCMKGSGSKKKPCSFFMEGVCRRTDCKFAHDVSNITCRFWAEGECFKAEMCPFLHGYFPKIKDEASARNPRSSKFEFQAEDFPDLKKVLKDGESKSKTLPTKKNPYLDAKASNKNSRRAQVRSADKGKATPCEGKPSLQTNIKCSAFPRKTTSSSAPKNKQ